MLNLNDRRPRARSLSRLAFAFSVAAPLSACGSSSDASSGPGDSASDTAIENLASQRGATSRDVPGGGAPVAPINNPGIEKPDAPGTMAAAMQPGDWFQFELGYSARIESVRAAMPGEVETEAMGGGASIINIQVHYDGEAPSSDYSYFRLDTDPFNEAYCVDHGAGYFEVLMNKGDTANIPYCVHLEPGGYNAVTLFSYVGSSQSWGAVYAIVAPDGVIEPAAPGSAGTTAPGF